MYFSFRLVLNVEDVVFSELKLKLLLLYVVNRICSDSYCLDVSNDVMSNMAEVMFEMPHAIPSQQLY